MNRAMLAINGNSDRHLPKIFVILSKHLAPWNARSIPSEYQRVADMLLRIADACELSANNYPQ